MVSFEAAALAVALSLLMLRALIRALCPTNRPQTYIPVPDDDIRLDDVKVDHLPPPGPLSVYEMAFLEDHEPFLTYYSILEDKSIATTEYSRGQFWLLARRCAGVLHSSGIGAGDHFALLFSGNSVEDLAFRLGAVMVGATPVTVNWQADTLDRVIYKIVSTQSRLIVVGPWHGDSVIFQNGLEQGLIDLAEQLRGQVDVTIHRTETLTSQPPLPDDRFCTLPSFTNDSSRIVIFTSGTTEDPKGVRLSYKNYAVNQSTFETFLEVGQSPLALVIVNPLHHTNSTAITDWAMRRAGARVYLFERYSTLYWSYLVRSIQAEPTNACIVAPLVSRHFDFLETLADSNKLPVELSELQSALNRTLVLIGSAPVGPTTVDRFRRFANKLPVVRFGSTETCLQVLGTPPSLPESNRQEAFERGWNHKHDGNEAKGFYIGRPHWPYTKVRVVRRICEEGDDDGMTDAGEGEPGYLITSGDNVMAGYMARTPSDALRATKAVLRRDQGNVWFTNFGDICFWLRNSQDGARDYYWVGRDSAMLIKGGANYAYDQVSAELKAFARRHYGVAEDALDLAVVGLRLDSEHEDSCVVTIEVHNSQDLTSRLASFVSDCKGHVTKGAQPQYLRFAKIPKTFKGSIETKVLRAECEAWARSNGLGANGTTLG